jgi:hypothetical protein
MPRKAQKTQTARAHAVDVMPNASIRVQRSRAHAAAKQKFGDVADRLADALADVIDHPDCPEYLQMRIAELHNGVVSEFNCEVSHDVRMRFADACVYAAESRRPA